jgi:phosphate transport system permease protein
LTSGLTSSSSISLANPGQTLTTRIYAQIYTANIHDGTNIMYECAFVTMMLVLLIILVVHVIIPAYYNFKKRQLQSQSKIVRKQQELFDQTHAHMQKIFTEQDILKYQNYMTKSLTKQTSKTKRIKSGRKRQ